MSFDDIYVNNTALDAAFVSCLLPSNSSCQNHRLCCQGYAVEHASPQLNTCNTYSLVLQSRKLIMLTGVPSGVVAFGINSCGIH